MSTPHADAPMTRRSGSRRRTSDALPRVRVGRSTVALICAVSVILVGLSTSASSLTSPTPATSVPIALTHTTPVTAAPGDPVPGQYLVTFAATVSGTDAAKRAAAIVSRTGGTVITVYTDALVGFAVRADERTAAAIKADPAVAQVEQDAVAVAAEAPTGSWGADRLDQSRLPLDGDYTHKQSGAGVDVFVVDSGVDTDTTELAGRVREGLVGTREPSAPPCSEHGTDVAATIAGTSYGVAPATEIVSVDSLKCNGNGTVSQVVTGLDWIAQHATAPAIAVVTATAGRSDALDRATDAVIARGITVVVAAGNQATNACASSPGRVTDAITVAATDRDDRRAVFSNFGPCIDLFAPGVDLPSTARPTERVNGTSISAALVAGAAARLLEVDPDALPTEISDRLARQAVDAVVDAGDDTTTALLNTSILDDEPSQENPPTTSTISPPTTTPAPTSTGVPAGAPDDNTVSSSAVPAGGGLSVFAIGADQALWWRQQTTAGWSEWQSFGGSLVGTPTATSSADGVFVFARGVDSALWYQRYDNTSWSGWRTLDGQLTSDPEATVAGGTTYVVVRGSDNAAWSRRFDGNWSAWRYGGGNLTSTPVPAPNGSGVEVFGRGIDGALWTQHLDAAGVTPFASLGGAMVDDPSAATDSTGLSVFVRSNTSSLMRRRLSDGSWGAWQDLGGFIITSPTAVASSASTSVFAVGGASGAYTMQVSGATVGEWTPLGGFLTAPLAGASNSTGVTAFARGGGNGLHVNSFTSAWSGWSPLPSITFASGPAVVATAAIAAGPRSPTPTPGPAPGAFVTSTDSQMWWRNHSASGWWAWQSFGGIVRGTPSVVTSLTGTYVFIRGADNGLWYQRFDGARWSGWVTLGGQLTSDPVAVSDGETISVLVRGIESALWTRQLSTGWSQWSYRGGTLPGAIAATTQGSDVHVFARGTENALWWQRISPSGGTGWVPLGGSIVGDPTASSDSGGTNVIARGPDLSGYRRRLVGSTWIGWQPLGGTLVTTPTSAARGDTTYVFGVGIDAAAWVLKLTGGSSSGWSSLGGYITAPLAPAATSSGITLFARGGDNGLHVNMLGASWSGWAPLAGVPLSGAPGAAASAQIDTAPPALPYGLGFDTCETPSLGAMSTWRAYSPYTSVGIYIGGVNRACRNAALDNPSWVNTVVAQGWRLIPTYVGLQAPCINFTSAQFSRNSTDAFWQGVGDADDAANRATSAGLRPGVPIYFDLEGYNSADAGCVAAVRSFIYGWTVHIRARGYQSGMYSSLCSGIRDIAAQYTDPSSPPLDAIWIAAWNNTPNIFGFGPPCALSDSLWTYHARIHQYQGGHNESYGGVTINIDTNAVDGPTAP